MTVDLMYGNAEFENQVGEMKEELEAAGSSHSEVLARFLSTVQIKHPKNINDLQAKSFVNGAILTSNKFGLPVMSALESQWIHMNK